MNYLAHLIIAFIVAGVAAFALAIPLTLQLVAVTTLGASLPDVDHSKTRVFKVAAALVAASVFVFAKNLFQQILQPGGDGLTAFVYAFACAVAALAVFYLAKPRHRGVTHSLAALAVFSATIFALTKNTSLAFVGGLAFFSHLAADREIKII